MVLVCDRKYLIISSNFKGINFKLDCSVIGIWINLIVNEFCIYLSAEVVPEHVTLNTYFDAVGRVSNTKGQ